MAKRGLKRPPSGEQIDFTRRVLKFKKNPVVSTDVFASQWINDWYKAIKDIDRNGNRSEFIMSLGDLWSKGLKRWHLKQVANSSTAWIERDVLYSAMMMDHRVKRLNRRNRMSGTEAHLMANEAIQRLSETEGVRPLSRSDVEQVNRIFTFAMEWQQYLFELMIRPPGPPPSGLCIASGFRVPSQEVKNIVCRLAHCRPVGAFFQAEQDEWFEIGGKDTCGFTTLCPYCDARRTAALVKRIEQGPWSIGRRRGKQLMFIRVAFSTDDLELDQESVEYERDNNRLYRTLRTSYDFNIYDEEGYGNHFEKIDLGQHMEFTITPSEVRKAKQKLKDLERIAKEIGANGGIRVHRIGPQGRKFLHEFSVVCSINTISTDGIEELIRQRTLLGSKPIEIVLFPNSYKTAIRASVAGTSARFSLNRVGAVLNSKARESCFYPELAGGFRGAMSAQPLFLLAGISFWSLCSILHATKCQSYYAFGDWKESLSPIRDYQSGVTQRRKKERNSHWIGLSNGRTQRDLLRSKLRCGTISQASLAREANLSKAAVSDFITKGKGSNVLEEKLRNALLSLGSDERSLNTFADVRLWLTAIGQPQSWLAEQLGCHSSTVSRNLRMEVAVVSFLDL